MISSLLVCQLKQQKRSTVTQSSLHITHIHTYLPTCTTLLSTASCLALILGKPNLVPTLSPRQNLFHTGLLYTLELLLPQPLQMPIPGPSLTRRYVVASKANHLLFLEPQPACLAHAAALGQPIEPVWPILSVQTNMTLNQPAI